MFATKTDAEAEVIKHPTTGVPVLRVWKEDHENGSFYVKTFKPKASKFSYYYRFKTAEDREKWLAGQIKSAIAWADEKAKRKVTRESFKHGYKIGDLLHGSWGYDQTNCEYYQVVGTSEKSVTVRRIKAETVPGSEGFMSERLKPLKDTMYGEAIRAIVRPSSYQAKGYVTIGHATCSETTEDAAHYNSWYA